VKSFFRFLLLALFLLLVAMVSALTAMRFAVHGSEVAVPDLKGATPAEARRMAEQNGLLINIEQQYYSSAVPEGRILSQRPPAGTKVRRGWQLGVAESLGPQRVEIPSLLEQSERAADINIQRRGLNLGTIAQLQLPGTLGGQVISQSPPPKASGVSAPKISLLISDVPQPQAFVMPSFQGQPLGTVTLLLQDAGFRVGTVTLVPEPGGPQAADELVGGATPSPASIVVSHSPAPGEKVLAGTAVNFEVR
jgi:beta-lactam-binding protein with PASTA domain